MTTNVIHNILTATDRKRLVKRGATVVPSGITTTDNILIKSGVDKAKRRKLLRRNLLTFSTDEYVSTDEEGLAMPLIDSVVITNAPGYFDVPLPAGFDVFELKIIGLVPEDAGTDSTMLIAHLSTDGGSTFLAQIGGGTANIYYGFKHPMDDFSSGLTNPYIALTTDGSDNQGDPPAGAPLYGTLTIYPGSSTMRPIVSSRTLRDRTNNANVDKVASWTVDMALDPQDFAEGELTLARINLIRFQFYGVDGSTPPPDTRDIVSCTWFLRGEATPA